MTSRSAKTSRWLQPVRDAIRQAESARDPKANQAALPQLLRREANRLEEAQRVKP